MFSPFTLFNNQHLLKTTYILYAFCIITVTAFEAQLLKTIFSHVICLPFEE